ncbi:MAG: 50S ribosomal protein L21 [Candidatus Paceibacterota bacterium]
MEFAVIETGGKQYKVSKGDSITIEKLSAEYKKGDKVIFDKVLMVDDEKNTTIGTPYIDGATVEAVFEDEGRGKKVTVVQYKPKSRYKKTKGHRQPFAKVTISAIK